MYLRRNLSPARALAGHPSRSQRGVVLLVALIVLVALTLAGVALIRSVDTANLIAGNLSFHQSAIHAGERSTELAVANWLEPNNALGNVSLFTDSPAVSGVGNGYIASRQDPAVGVSWDDFWAATLATQAVTGAQDAAGNTVSYVIQRLCDSAGPPQAANVNCATSPSSNSGGSQTAGGLGNLKDSQIYYRITTRIAGPRNTVAYIQTIIAL
jgi:type IV pilus assembly protein PilX